MSKNERLTIVRAFSKQYRKESKHVKGEFLDRLSTATGYSRKHLMALLVQPVAKKVFHRHRPSKYLSILSPLKQLWAISNYACGQRLVPMIPVYLESLARHGEMLTKLRDKKLLLSVSSATVNRLLKPERKRINLKGKSRTKPGTLLKHQIPIKTWAEWDNAIPGFTEIDSVHHCGSSLYGEYLYTLDLTDVATGWNECCAHLGRSERFTVAALETIRKRLPFALLGIDFDSGGEFVNYHLIRYCQTNQITYTRSRQVVKNDQAYVEQQNYSVVRRFVGYQRLDTPEQLVVLNRLYQLLSDYQNFFQPVMRLKSKTRDGARVTRKYDTPRTAYQRVLDRTDITQEIKDKLTHRFLALNPKRLLLEISKLGQKLSLKR